MKVVLFCGGMGMRLRDGQQNTPKPLVTIGYRPIMWHVMNYYSHYGHDDFILCLGYQAGTIKEYFLNYNEMASNDFVLSKGGKQIDLLSSDIHDWRISFVDTGINSNIGQRLMAVKKHVADEEVFLANYSDGLCDIPLDRYVDEFMARGKIAAFVAVRPGAGYAFHIIESDQEDLVTRIKSIRDSDVRINGGFFIFRQQIFDYIKDGEELVVEPFSRLADEKQLVAHPWDGFWQCMDTFKDKQVLEDLAARDDAPWQVWTKK